MAFRLLGPDPEFELLILASTPTSRVANPCMESSDCGNNPEFSDVYGNTDALFFLAGRNALADLKDNVRGLFKQTKCAALFGDEKNALKQLAIASIYPPGSFNPSVPGSIPANYILLSYPHGAAFAAGNIFLGPKFFDQSIGAQETLLIHELRHQAYNTGEPPYTSPAYQAHRTKEDQGIVAACGTQMPTKN